MHVNLDAAILLLGMLPKVKVKIKCKVLAWACLLTYLETELNMWYYHKTEHYSTKWFCRKIFSNIRIFKNIIFYNTSCKRLYNVQFVGVSSGKTERVSVCIFSQKVIWKDWKLNRSSHRLIGKKRIIFIFFIGLFSSFPINT